MDEVDLRMTFGSAAGRVDVKSAKIFAVFQRLGYGQISEVLVSEDENLPLCGKKGQLILASVRQLTELDARENSTNVRGQILTLCRWSKEFRE